MITIVARWENEQMPSELEWRMWRQLRGFDISRFVFTPIIPELSNVAIEQYATMEEALSHVPEENRVFLEATGTKRLTELPPRSEDVIFILGNTGRHNKDHAKDGEMYRIEEPRLSHMYPTSAGAIALAYWWGQ